MSYYCYYETAAIDGAKSLQTNLAVLWDVSMYDPQMKRQAERTIKKASRADVGSKTSLRRT